MSDQKYAQKPEPMDVGVSHVPFRLRISHYITVLMFIKTFVDVGVDTWALVGMFAFQANVAATDSHRFFSVLGIVYAVFLGISVALMAWEWSSAVRVLKKGSIAPIVVHPQASHWKSTISLPFHIKLHDALSSMTSLDRKCLKAAMFKRKWPRLILVTLPMWAIAMLTFWYGWSMSGGSRQLLKVFPMDLLGAAVKSILSLVDVGVALMSIVTACIVHKHGDHVGESVVSILNDKWNE